MQITYNLLAETKSAFEILKTKAVPIKTAYKIAKLLKACAEEETFYQEKYKEIIDACSMKDEAGNYLYADEEHTQIKVEPTKMGEASCRLEELNKLKIDLPDIKITLAELENLGLTAEDLTKIIDFIEEEAE